MGERGSGSNSNNLGVGYNTKGLTYKNTKAKQANLVTKRRFTNI